MRGRSIDPAGDAHEPAASRDVTRRRPARPRRARRRRPDRLARATAAEAPAADRAIAGEGALLTPAFVDAHVHATATGLALTGLDLHSSVEPCRRPSRRVAAARRGAPTRHRARHRLGRDRAGPSGRGLTRHDLDAVVGDRPAYLARVDVHSATVSTALLDRVPGHRRAARVRPPTAGCASTPTTPPGRPRSARSAPTSAAPPSGPPSTPRAALGIGSVHEMAGPEVSGADDLAGLLGARRRASPAREVLGYWGELAERGGLDVVRELGLAGAGGDLFCDGAFGSHTARAGRRPYTDRPDTAGHAALRHRAAASTTCGPARAPASRPASTCIGDAAVAQVLDAVERGGRRAGRGPPSGPAGTGSSTWR